MGLRPPDLATWSGFVYTAFVIDVFARRLVGWPVSRIAQAPSCWMPWSMARHAPRPVRDGDLVHHGDKGSRYLSIRCTERLAEVGVEPSVGRVGDSDDNALAGTIDGLFESEPTHRRGPRRNLEAGALASLE